MAFLTRSQVKVVVIDSLRTIADLPADVEAATFAMANAQQKKVFLANLKSKLNALPYQLDSGGTSNDAYYDVDLMPTSTDNWPTVKDCIDWVTANQKVIYN
jgi:hypothetical protein